MKLQLSVAETVLYTCPRGIVPHRHGELGGISSVTFRNMAPHTNRPKWYIKADGMLHSLLTALTGITKYYFDLLIQLCHRHTAVTTTPSLCMPWRNMGIWGKVPLILDNSTRVRITSEIQCGAQCDGWNVVNLVTKFLHSWNRNFHHHLDNRTQPNTT